MNVIEEVMSSLPESAMVSDICFEGSEIVVYTQSREFFLSNGDFIKDIVKRLKKRIEIRPDPSITVDMEVARERIKEIVPEEAGITDITFEPGFSRVTIEAHKPGLVIGKGGQTLAEIKKKTFWAPVITRAPAIKSDVVKTVRRVIFEESEFRKEFLNKLGQRIHGEKKKEVEWIRLTALGGFREVGRSCLYLQTPESKVLLDCGIKAGADDAFPYLSVPEFNLKGLDAVIASHPHLDHVGFIPYLYEYGYEGPFYCTPPTRDLFVLLCLDYLDIAQREGNTVPYSSKSIEKAVKHSVVLEYNEVNDITPDMRLTFQNAGHILGSAIVHIHVGEGDHNIIYTGDYNYDRTKLFDPAFTNFQRAETVITESTYGSAGDIQPKRSEAEKRLVQIVKETLEGGGKVLIPSFAVGRAQDVMCILAAQKDFNYPVYLEGMLWDATAIHTTYPEYMSRELQNEIFHKGNNPFTAEIFKRVGSHIESCLLYTSPSPRD